MDLRQQRQEAPELATFPADSAVGKMIGDHSRMLDESRAVQGRSKPKGCP